MDARCMRCRKQVEIKNGAETKTSKGLRIVKGVCPNCSTKVCRILGK
jgi:DNA-directed RNA polymerase subunit RPC12/RpoP